MPPPYPLHGSGSDRRWSAVTGELVLRSIQNRFFVHGFQMPFWLHFEAIRVVFWRPNGPKFGLRCPSKRYLLQKRDFHETFIKTHDFLCFLAPRSTPKRPKTGPRSFQEGLESLLV